MTTRPDPLAERFVLKMLVEACLVLEDGVATADDIDVAMAKGAGIVPPPFARADAQGLDVVLIALEMAQREWGEEFAPPATLRRLVADGHFGRETGRGFLTYSG